MTLWHSFNDLVGACQNRRWQVETERLRGFEIDHELIFVRRLDRQFGWLLALENAVDVARRAPVLVGRTRPVANQATIGDERRERIDRRQSIATMPGGFAPRRGCSPAFFIPSTMMLRVLWPDGSMNWNEKGA